MRRIAQRLTLAACAALTAFGFGGEARAGGFFLPDNGTEPLGRGGAFVAKADSPLAMYYNVAGIARQDGVRLTIDASVIFQDMAFTRAGNYPTNATNVDGSPAAYAGKPYPTVHNSGGPFLLPSAGVTWKLPWVRHLAIGFGIYGPPSVGKQQYGTPEDIAIKDKNGNPLTGKGYTTTLADGTVAPTPSRYDVTSTNLLIILPTFGVAWGPVKWLDIGAAFQLVYGTFNLENANMFGGRDDPGWDAYGQISASGIAYNGLFSLLAHPTPWLDIGAQYQPHVSLHTTGTIKALPQQKLPQQFDPFPVTFDTALPHKLSVGARIVSRYADDTERADLEVDGVWEKWSDVQTDHIHTDDAPAPIGNPTNTLDVDIAHFYRDTFGLRVGGAYNYRLNDTMRLIGRAGFYFDSAASHLQDTHLDFNTAAKYAFTLGAGFKVKGFTINLAYAYVYSPDRNVTNGELHPVSAISGTNYNMGDPIASYVYNNGLYQYSTHIVSLGLTFNFSEFKRPALFAN